jgi:O-antigen/teichoic acid export membrane protein
MINLKEHFKLSAMYTFFAAFPPLLQLIVYPVIEGEARLGPVDFGYLAITEAIITIIFMICSFSMGTGLARFFYDYKDDPAGCARLISSVIISILGRGMVIMGVVLLLAPNIGQLFPHPALQDFGSYGPALVIAGLNRSIIVAMLALYRNEKRLAAFVIVSLSSGLLRSGFQLAGVFFYDLSFIGYVFGTATGSTITAAGVMIYSFYSYGIHFKREILKPVYKFAWPLFLTELLYWGLLFGDRFFLLNNPDQLGIYDNAMKFAIGIQLIIQGLASAIQPEVFRYMKAGFKTNESEIRTLSNIFMAEAAGIIALSIIPVMAFISLFYETDLTLSAGLISIVFVRFLLRAQYQVFAWPLLYRKKTRVFLYINSLVLIVNLTINWLITTRVGFYGAITAFLTAYIIQITALKIIQQRIVPAGYNNVKVYYFPLCIVFSAVILEIIKVVFSVNPFLTSGMLVVVIGSGLARIYRHELMKLFTSLHGILFTSGNTGREENDK